MFNNLFIFHWLFSAIFLKDNICDCNICDWINLLVLSQSYIKRFIWYNLYGSSRLSKLNGVYTVIKVVHYQVHKSWFYRLFRLQEFKQNDLRTSCSSSKSSKKGKKEESMWKLVRLVESYKLYHTNRLMKERFYMHFYVIFSELFNTFS